jgi:hypothetical protein
MSFSCTLSQFETKFHVHSFTITAFHLCDKDAKHRHTKLYSQLSEWTDQVETCQATEGWLQGHMIALSFTVPPVHRALRPHSPYFLIKPRSFFLFWLNFSYFTFVVAITCFCIFVTELFLDSRCRMVVFKSNNKSWILLDGFRNRLCCWHKCCAFHRDSSV